MLALSEVSSSLLVLRNRNKWLVEVEGDSVGVNLIRCMFLWLDVTPHHLHRSPRPSLLSPSDSLRVSGSLCGFMPTCGNEMVINSSNTCAHKVCFKLVNASQVLSKSPKNFGEKRCYCECPSVTQAVGPNVSVLYGC